jgi:hypothetical protein
MTILACRTVELADLVEAFAIVAAGAFAIVGTWHIVGDLVAGMRRRRP